MCKKYQSFVQSIGKSCWIMGRSESDLEMFAGNWSVLTRGASANT